MKTLAKLLFINTLVFALMLGMFELGIRIFVPQNLRADPENSHIGFGFSYRPKPGYKALVKRAERIVTWKINSQGLRDNEIPYQKPVDTYRIVGLGDSFTFGFHVEQEETYLHRLEKMLNDRPDLALSIGKQQIQTINMGVGAYGVAAAHHMLQQEGLRYTPDLIVTAVFVGNDLGETLNEHRRRIDTSQQSDNSAEVIDWIYDEAGKSWSWRVRKYLGSHFQSYVFLTTRLNILMVRLKLVRVDDATIDVLRVEESETVSQGWQQLTAYLEEIQAVALENHAEHLVMIIPLRHQVDEQEWSLLRQTYNLAAEDFELDRPQRILKEFFINQGIDYIDLLPMLRQSENNAYYAKDPHFNVAGHSIAAAALFQHISNQLNTVSPQ